MTISYKINGKNKTDENNENCIENDQIDRIQICGDHFLSSRYVDVITKNNEIEENFRVTVFGWSVVDPGS